MKTLIEQEQLESFLIDSGLVTKEVLEKAKEKALKSNKSLEDVLLEDKIVAQENLTKLKAYILGIPFVNLEKEKVPEKILKLIPENVARRYNVVPFKLVGNNLEVAMLDPQDLRIIDFVKKITDLNIIPRLTTKESIKNVLKQYEGTLKEEFENLIEKTEEGEIVSVKEGGEKISKSELQKTAEEFPIIKLVDTILKHGIVQSASDIHIEPTEKDVIVRYRIDGVLRDAMVLPKSLASGIVARIKVLSNLKLDEYRLPQDGRFKVETPEYSYSVRVSILPVTTGEKVVMRLLPESTKPLKLEELGFWGVSLERVNMALTKTAGLILVTGPTGSGKTTTLYSMLHILNTPEVNISTLEDPVEYRMPRINQSQIRPEIGFTFANGLRALVRQDPDIIMVGEVRDTETAMLCVNAALTGHLVLSTLHTINSSGAITRLIHMNVEPFLLASTVNIVIAQRLVRKLCAKEEYSPSQELIDNISNYLDIKRLESLLVQENIIKKGQTIKDVKFYRPKGTKECPDGYKGRIGIFEVLEITDEIRDLIVKKADATDIEKVALQQGMITMIEDGFIKAAKGITSVEEVLRVITQ
ncbi:Type II secretion system protein E [bacterium HR34]|nr:Type II secretion system protein E [bacterium HR34]